MRKKLLGIILLNAIIAFTSTLNANADSANPPKILGISLVNAKATNNVGDVLAFDVSYSGGNPGVTYVMVFFMTTAPGCLNPDNYAIWNENAINFWDSSKEIFTESILGPYMPGKIRVYATVNSNCLNGANSVYVSRIELGDKSGLVANTQLDSEWFGRGYPLQFNLNLVGGLYVPVGTVIEAQKPSSFSLDILNETYVIDEKSPTLIKLPTTTSEGIFIYFNAHSGQAGVCKEVRSYPLSHVDLLLTGAGQCEITASIGQNVRSSFTPFNLKKSVKLISKAAADKAAADKAAADKAAADKAAADKAAADKAAADKAAADKAAADKAAADKAAADKAAALARKSTITCQKGKISKKVTAVKPKCPPGYKIKK